MFSVPGWKVSATSLVQDQPRSSKRKDSESQRSLADSSKQIQKRKFDDPKSRAKQWKRTKIDSVEEDGDFRNGEHAVTSEAAKNSDDGWKKKDVKKTKSKASQPCGPKRDEFKDEDEKVNKVLGSAFVGESEKKDKKQQQQQQRQPVHERQRQLQHQHQHQADVAKLAALPPAPPTALKLTPLQMKMRNKLTSARFRHLNEMLYTTSSSAALEMFQSSPDLFSEYHAGFAQQVKDSWPQNPVEQYVQIVQQRGRLKQQPNPNHTQPRSSATSDGANRLLTLPLPRRKTGSCTIADLGCGDAPLARGCQSVAQRLQLTFRSYDLHAPNSFVTQADMANLPLQEGEADVVVFCLSLMGTNWLGFVEEAWRILRGDGKGEVWVSEVKSRFGRFSNKGRVVENSVGKRRKTQQKSGGDGEETNVVGEGTVLDAQTEDAPPDETDVSAFIDVFQRRGFRLREGSVDKSNKMFVSMIFMKAGIPTAGKHKGMKWTGQEYQRVEDRRTKNSDVDNNTNANVRFGSSWRRREPEEIGVEDEGKVLKPCVYKVR